MKTRFLWLLLAALFVIPCAQAQETFTVKVAGYEPKGFEISPAMAQQLTTQVVARVQSALKKSPRSEVTVSIAGYADKTGTRAENATWGEKRATSIYEFLVTRLPRNVTFGSYPVGSASSLDERAVILTVSIAPATPAPVPVPPSQRSHPLVVGAVGFLILTAVFFAFKLHSAKHPRSVSVPSAAMPITPENWLEEETKEEVVKVVEVERDGKTICVPIKKHGGLFLIPFPHPNDVRDNLQDAKKAAKNGIKDPKRRVSDIELQALIAGKAVWRKGE